MFVSFLWYLSEFGDILVYILGLFWDHFAVVLVTFLFWGMVLVSCWFCFRVVWGLFGFDFWVYFVTVLVSVWYHVGTVLG